MDDDEAIEIALAETDECAREVIAAYQQLGEYALMLRTKDDGNLALITPKIDNHKLAAILRLAADDAERQTGEASRTVH